MKFLNECVDFQNQEHDRIVHLLVIGHIGVGRFRILGGGGGGGKV